MGLKGTESFIPAGYMYKTVGVPIPERPFAKNIVDVYSAGTCGGSVTECFDFRYHTHWMHNEYWFFNSPEIMQEIALKKDIDLSSMHLFYYEIYEREFDQTADPTPVQSWSIFNSKPPSSSWITEVVIPTTKDLVGYDVVEYTLRSNPECSLLGCSDISTKFAVNSHCLFDTFEQSKIVLESGEFHAHEPGPYRIISVYLIASPKQQTSFPTQ